MKIYYKSIAAMTLVALVAGCQSTPRPSYNNTAPPVVANRGIEGQWRATEGPLLATFTGSKFQSVNTENNQVVAAGAYSQNSGGDVRLEWVGALSGRSSANCQLVNPNLMNCSPSNGSGFQLRRV